MAKARRELTEAQRERLREKRRRQRWRRQSEEAVVFGGRTLRHAVLRLLWYRGGVASLSRFVEADARRWVAANQPATDIDDEHDGDGFRHVHAFFRTEADRAAFEARFGGRVRVPHGTPGYGRWPSAREVGDAVHRLNRMRCGNGCIDHEHRRA